MEFLKLIKSNPLYIPLNIPLIIYKSFYIIKQDLLNFCILNYNNSVFLFHFCILISLRKKHKNIYYLR